MASITQACYLETKLYAWLRRVPMFSTSSASPRVFDLILRPREGFLAEFSLTEGSEDCENAFASVSSTFDLPQRTSPGYKMPPRPGWFRGHPSDHHIRLTPQPSCVPFCIPGSAAWPCSRRWWPAAPCPSTSNPIRSRAATCPSKRWPRNSAACCRPTRPSFGRPTRAGRMRSSGTTPLQSLTSSSWCSPGPKRMCRPL